MKEIEHPAVRVSEPPYLAAGDGVTPDRAAIQKAIDDVFHAGGGTVILDAGKTFLTAGLVLRSGVTLFFEDGATLLQDPDRTRYVKPSGDGYEPYLPAYGHNFSPEIKWSHNWYHNFPLLFAPAGSHGFAVRGNGVVRMMEVTDPEKIIKICPVGFFRCRGFEIADIHITNYHSYAMMPFSSDYGVIRNVKITDWSYGNGDGICLMNCQHMRVTGCSGYTGDDSLYIFSSCRDPRKSEWWNSDEPQPSLDIEIDHNDFKSHHCKAFGMILWGLNAGDLETVEVRDVYIHDNHFATMGNWIYNPYTDKRGNHPVTHVRFERNRIDAIEANFFDTQISDMNQYHSEMRLHNGDFTDGRVFWSFTKNADPDSAGVHREGGKEDQNRSYGYIRSLEKGRAALYQGVWIRAGERKLFRAETRAAGCACRLFVRDLDSGELCASLPFSNEEWEEKNLWFEVPADGNYQVGLEGDDPRGGEGFIRWAVLGNHEAAEGYRDVYFDTGKILFRYGEEA